VRPALESYPGCEIGVLLPIDHEILFVGEATLWFDFAASGF
jgi:hypothetical protein